MNHFETLASILERVARDPHVDRGDVLSAVFEEFRSLEEPGERSGERNSTALAEARRRDLHSFFRTASGSVLEALIDTSTESAVDFDSAGFGRGFDPVTLSTAIDRLREECPDEASIFELCFLAGLTRVQTAELLEKPSEEIEAGYQSAKRRLSEWLDPSPKP